jgi:hypothetical protein
VKVDSGNALLEKKTQLLLRKAGEVPQEENQEAIVV